MRKLFYLLALILLITACRPSSNPTPAPASPDPPLGQSGPHFLLNSPGPVQLFREEWSDYNPISFGTILWPTDLLKVNSESKVLCNGQTLKVEIISTGEQRMPCPLEQGILNYRGDRFRVRGADISSNNDIPFILYPRNTLLLDARPTLYWNDTGASSYSVALQQGGRRVWEKENVTGPSLSYPDEAAPLESGKDYRLVVTDNDSQVSSEEDEPPGVGFRLATEAEQISINEGISQLKSLNNLSGPDLEFALGVYYTGLAPSPQGFRPLGEAWLIFKALAPTQTSPAIQLWYGDVLNGLKLPDESEIAYQAALTQAKTFGDLENEGLANVRLWCTNTEEEFFDQAIRVYEQLGDQARVKILQEGKDLFEACKKF